MIKIYHSEPPGKLAKRKILKWNGYIHLKTLVFAIA